MIEVVRHNETGEVEISADPDGMVALAEAIRHAPAVVDAGEPESTWPYDEALRQIRTEVSDDAVLFVYEDATKSLRITGRQQGRDVLAENFADFAREGTPGEHWHVEWFPDHFYLGEGSAPVVVALQDA